MSDLTKEELLHGFGGRLIGDVMEDPVPNFLFENCFRDKSITVFVAPPHRGKTLLMMDMALCLDMELPLFGRFQPIAGRKVFFLGCDAPSWDYGLQARKLSIGHGISVPERKLLDIAGVWRSGKKITDPAVRDWLEGWRKFDGADVLFIDTHRATHGANENDSGEMEKVWDILKDLRDRGWCIIMSHHTSKPSEVLQEDVHAARGSTVIGASADFIYTLNKKSRKDNRVQVCCVKGRGASDEDDPFTFFDITSVLSEESVNGRPLYGLRLLAAAEDTIKFVLGFLESGPKNRSAISTHVRTLAPETCKNMDEQKLYRYIDNRLQELRQLGKVKITERGVWGLC